jgi:hypothetical protein
MKMAVPQIVYDRDISMGAYNDDPMSFILHEKFFNDFLLVTNMSMDWLGETDYAGNIHSLNIGNKPDRQAKTLHSKKFVSPYKVNPLTYLMNSPTIAHAYENKRYFRDEFSELIRMPEYKIFNVNDLDKAASYKEIRTLFNGTDFVLQDEESHGSRGTFVVHSFDEYLEAVENLKEHGLGRSVVVSKLVKGYDASIQVCITKYGIFSAGVQKQLIGSKYLCNPKLSKGSKWCGGELGADIPEIVTHQAQEMATIIGSELASHGYKGIFGIDIMVTSSKQVYAIEINARHTGYSHIISDMQLTEGKIPFLLLHALELGNIPYEVTDLDALPSGATYKKPVSYMILINPKSESVVMKKEIKSGVYTFRDGKIAFKKRGYLLEDLGSDVSAFLVHTLHRQGGSVGGGERIMKVTRHGKGTVKSELNLKNQDLVKAVKKHFQLPK